MIIIILYMHKHEDLGLLSSTHVRVLNRVIVQREIAKIWTNCSNFEESIRFGTQVVLTNTKRFS